jgi:hypothetical protein
MLAPDWSEKPERFIGSERNTRTEMIDEQVFRRVDIPCHFKPFDALIR